MAGCKLLVIANKDRPELARLADLPAGVETVAVGTSFEALTDEDLAQVDAVLVGAGPTGGTRAHLQAVWPKLKGCKWIHSSMAGLDFFMFPELAESDVTVTNAKGAFSGSLAEFAIFAAKFFALDGPRLLRQKQGKVFEKYEVEELAGKTMSIIGYGDIGQATGKLAKAFGMKVLATRRNPEASKDDPVLDEIFRPDQINEMVSRSDYVVASTPLTPETHKIVSAEVIGSMKATAVFINIGRGPCVDEDALVAALQQRKIKGAGLDVFAVEPLPATSPLWEMDNVFISPHCADNVDGWLDNSIQLFVDNMHKYVQGSPLSNVVGKKRGY